MITTDLVNAAFEAGTSGAIALDCWAAYRAKRVAGINMGSSTFFTIYSAWGAFYLWDLDQGFSAAVSLSCFVLDLVFIGQTIYYRRRAASVVPSQMDYSVEGGLNGAS